MEVQGSHKKCQKCLQMTSDYTTGQNPHSCVRHLSFTSVDFVPWTKTTLVMRTFFGIIQGIERICNHDVFYDICLKKNYKLPTVPSVRRWTLLNLSFEDILKTFWTLFMRSLDFHFTIRVTPLFNNVQRRTLGTVIKKRTKFVLFLILKFLE